MPSYEFECQNMICATRNFTIKHGYNEAHPTICPSCGNSIRQMLTPIPSHFKGKGFFATDNKKDTRVMSESGVLSRRVSETDASNIDEETPTIIGDRGRPKMTPTRPKPVSKT